MSHISAWDLLQRGDRLSIENGVLKLAPASGKPVPDSWLKEHSAALINHILRVIEIDSFGYRCYTTGRYVKAANGGGITLQFINTLTNEEAYVIFNVDLTRQRTTKYGVKGTPLAAGRFVARKRSKFLHFWQLTGLAMPPRLSSFHDYMGNLAQFVFTAQVDIGGKILKDTLTPLNMPYEKIFDAAQLHGYLPDNVRTTAGQLPDNSQTKIPDKDVMQTQGIPPLQPISNTGAFNYGTSLSGDTGLRGRPSPINSMLEPEHQSVDEWVEAYNQQRH